MKHELKFYFDLGEKIKIRRRLLRIPQENIGKRLGLHQAAVCRIEASTQLISLYEVIKLASLLKTDINGLLDDTPIEVTESVFKSRLKGMHRSKFIKVIPDPEDISR